MTEWNDDKTTTKLLPDERTGNKVKEMNKKKAKKKKMIYKKKKSNIEICTKNAVQNENINK